MEKVSVRLCALLLSGLLDGGAFCARSSWVLLRWVARLHGSVTLSVAEFAAHVYFSDT